MIAGVAIDAWKLSIFKKHLDGAGYTYTEHPGLTEGTLFLKVNTDSASKLACIIEVAQQECYRVKHTH